MIQSDYKDSSLNTVKNAFLCQNLVMDDYLQESVLETNASELATLDLCHYSIKRIPNLSEFPQLQTLTIVAQDITEIVNLEFCPNLKELWIVESKLERIENLENCIKLEKLYLYGNHISKLENLSKLAKLKALWLSDNQISIVENLLELTSLVDLCLANNHINKIEPQNLTGLKLKRLNLAGNHICTIQDIAALANLQYLDNLTLNESDFAENPVCRLPSYELHISQAIPQISKLDELDIDYSFRETSQAVLFQKHVYYNSKKQIVQRNRNYAAKCIDAYLSRQLGAMFAKNPAVQVPLETLYNGCIAKLQALTELLCARYDLAFQSGGSVDLVADNTSSSSCVDLVAENTSSSSKSRCRSYNINNQVFSADFISIPADGIKNVYFGNDALKELLLYIQFGSNSDKVPNEYDLRQSEKTGFVVQCFPVFESAFNKIPPKTVSLASNSKNLPDTTTFRTGSLETVLRYIPFKLICLDAALNNDSAFDNLITEDLLLDPLLPETSLSFECADLEIIKIIDTDIKKLPDIQNSNRLDLINHSTVTSLNLSNTGLQFATAIESLSSLPELKELYLCKNNWSFLDQNRPLVTFEKFPKLELLDLSGNNLISLTGLFTHEEQLGLRELNVSSNSISSKIGFAPDKLLKLKKLEKLLVYGNPYFSTQRFFQLKHDLLLQVLAVPTVDKCEGPIVTFPNAQITSDSAFFTQLSPDMLVKLDLSNNNITDLKPLDKLKNLAVLCVENNSVCSLSGVQNLPNLSELYIGNNLLGNLQTFFYLRPLTKLLIIDYAGNPVCETDAASHRHFVVYQLYKATNGCFKFLNGLPVLTSETTKALEHFASRLTKETLFEIILTQESARRIKNNPQSGQVNSFYALLDNDTTQIFDSLINLNLSGMKLKYLDVFNTPDAAKMFPKLRKINLDENLLTNLDGLASLHDLIAIRASNNRLTHLISRNISPAVAIFPKLEELRLVGNAVTQFCNVVNRPFPRLRVLDLANNNVTKLDGISHALSQLSELYLQANFIKKWSLQFFSTSKFPALRILSLNDNRIIGFEIQDSISSALQTLHLHNNKVCELEQIENLGDLTDSCNAFCSLTLYGNPISQRSMYRNMCINKFQHLKKLDEKIITDAERQEVSEYQQLVLEQQQQLQNPLSMTSLNINKLGLSDLTRSRNPANSTGLLNSISALSLGNLRKGSAGTTRKFSNANMRSLDFLAFNSTAAQSKPSQHLMGSYETLKLSYGSENTTGPKAASKRNQFTILNLKPEPSNPHSKKSSSSSLQLEGLTGKSYK